MKLIKPQIALWMVFSLSGCATIRAPDTDLCIVNAPAKKRKCYNLAMDYQSDGRLKPTAKPVYRPVEKIEDLNKFLVVDSPTGTEDGQARLKAYIRALREEYQRGCRPPAVP